jgi:hypothetical protein
MLSMLENLRSQRPHGTGVARVLEQGVVIENAPQGTRSGGGAEHMRSKARRSALCETSSARSFGDPWESPYPLSTIKEEGRHDLGADA